jgi:hypothetical protein
MSEGNLCYHLSTNTYCCSWDLKLNFENNDIYIFKENLCLFGTVHLRQKSTSELFLS